MSRTLFVEWRGHGFWAYDVAVGILLKHVIDRTADELSAYEKSWLAECVTQWRVNAVVGEFGLHLDPDWSADQTRDVIALFDLACSDLGRVASISSVEAQSWDLLDGRGVSLRGDAAFPTTPVIDLGRALNALLAGELAPAPPGTRWLFGVEGGPSTIQQRNIDGA